jgi:curved DNA-binding protein CbpA
MPPRPQSNLYDLLKLERTATPEEIEQAFDAMCQLARSGGGRAGAEVEAGASAEGDEAASLARLEEAFLILSDPARRGEYDATLELAANGAPDAAEALAEAPEAPTTSTATARSEPPTPMATTASAPHHILVVSEPSQSASKLASPASEAVLLEGHHLFDTSDTSGVSRLPSKPPSKPGSGSPRFPSAPQGASVQRFGDARESPLNGPFTGAQLRRIRELRGLSLQELSDMTKVGLANLENIEAERYALLPPPVFLRGFLVLVAGALKLDPLRVTKDFLANGPAKSSG